MLGLALHGVFLEDEALTELAELPFIREFRLATGAWQRLDRRRLAEEQRAAAAEARRLLDEAAARAGRRAAVRDHRRRSGTVHRRYSQAGDIIVVAQPRLPAERLVHATARWLEAAHACAASVMLVPQALARGRARWRRWCVPGRIPHCHCGAHRRRGWRAVAAAVLGSAGARRWRRRGRRGPRACRHSGSSARDIARGDAGGCRCRAWVRATNVWSCWRAAPAGRTTQRYPRILRPRAAFPCWWSNPSPLNSNARGYSAASGNRHFRYGDCRARHPRDLQRRLHHTGRSTGPPNEYRFVIGIRIGIVGNEPHGPVYGSGEPDTWAH